MTAKTKPIDPIVLDIEASGFDLDSYPIEVGIAISGGKRVSSLIYPAESWIHWDDTAESVHQISNETLLKHGKPIKKVAESLNKLLKGRTVYAEDWVLDRPWMDMLFDEAGIEMAFELRSLQGIMTDKQQSIWNEVKQEVEAKSKLTRHRASSDAWMMQQAFILSRKKAAK